MDEHNIIGRPAFGNSLEMPYVAATIPTMEGYYKHNELDLDLLS